MLSTVLAAMGACSTLPRAKAGAVDRAGGLPLGIPGVRLTETEFAGGDWSTGLTPPRDGVLDVLAVSGGGAKGAFGAGVLIGWTRRGDRPVFEVVTGVSTGALIAPFAFLGSDRDAELRSAYTDEIGDKFLRSRRLAALYGTSVYDPRPLRALIERHMNEAVLSAIAREHQAGRRLFVVTTNLDTQRAVIWDMGAIASRQGQEARKLFVDVLLASASVPGVFPPVLLPVEAGPVLFDEMHVDGGVALPFLASTETLRSSAAALDEHAAARRLWVLINSNPEVETEQTSRNTIAITARSFETMRKAQLAVTLTSINMSARREGVAVYTAVIPSEVRSGGMLDFKPASMRRLFDEGARRAETGRIWRTPDAPSSRASGDSP